MSSEQTVISIRRVLVALDASPHSLAALTAAVELAARFRAELSGLFVEDDNLLRLANLPFVREVGLYTATQRQVTEDEMQRQMRVQSRTIRRIFTGSSQRAHVRWQFRTARGPVLTEVIAAAGEADVLVLGRSGWSALHRRQLGSTVRGIISERFGLALIAHERSYFGPPLAVVYDGSQIADRTLLAAETINRAADEDQTLLVVLLAHDKDEAEKMQKQAQDQLEGRDGNVRFHWLTSANVYLLNDILLAEGCAGLVMPARSTALSTNLLIDLLENIELSILLVT